MDKTDWQILRPTITWLCASFLITCFSYFFVDQYYNKSELKFQQNTKNYNNIQREVSLAKRELTILQEKLPEFNHLLESGVIGKEKRLDWVEVLRRKAQQLHVENIEYRIDEQKEILDKQFPVTGDYRLFRSRMHLNMQLLHEGDYLSLINTLKNNAKGLFHIDECKLYRTRSNYQITENYPNITVDCSLSWYTVRFKTMETRPEV